MRASKKVSAGRALVEDASTDMLGMSVGAAECLVGRKERREKVWGVRQKASEGVAPRHYPSIPYEGNTFEGTKVIRNASGLGRIGEDPAGGRCVRRGKAGAERGERRGRGGGRWRPRSCDEREAAQRRERKEN